jgi:hypothetical protein
VLEGEGKTDRAAEDYRDTLHMHKDEQSWKDAVIVPVAHCRKEEPGTQQRKQ